jgi:hypothetical protein
MPDPTFMQQLQALNPQGANQWGGAAMLGNAAGAPGYGTAQATADTWAAPAWNTPNFANWVPGGPNAPKAKRGGPPQVRGRPGGQPQQGRQTGAAPNVGGAGGQGGGLQALLQLLGGGRNMGGAGMSGGMPGSGAAPPQTGMPPQPGGGMNPQMMQMLMPLLMRMFQPGAAGLGGMRSGGGQLGTGAL